MQELITPPIVIHGLRHPSTNFKLSISDGDFKAIQGDFGWASVQMVEHYSHVENERRKKLSAKIEERFYNKSASKGAAENTIYTFLNDPAMRHQLLVALLADNAG